MLNVALRHDFGGFDIDVTFTAPAGVTALFGPSGAGKTTVVNAVAGLLRPQSGRVEAGGAVLLDTTTKVFLPPHKRRIGYVFQEPRLFPHMSVRSNLVYGQRFAPRTAQGPDFDAVTEILGIGALLDRRPGALSGGEKARVSIGRAMLSKPHLLLLDEPLAALDNARREEILPFIERLRDAGLPVLLVSHSITEVARLASTIVLLQKGRVVASGPATTLLSDPSLAHLLGGAQAGTVIPATVDGIEGDGLYRLHTSGGTIFVSSCPADVGKQVRLRIHASDVIVSRDRPMGLSALNILQGTVKRIETGTEGRAFVQIEIGDGQSILSRLTQRSVAALELRPGVSCHAILKTVAVSHDDIGIA